MLPMLWVNGIRMSRSHLAVSPLDRGITLADGLFETMRAYNGTIFRVGDHIARLTDGARALKIPLPHDIQAQLLSAIDAAVAAGHTELAVRLTVTRGVPLTPGLAPTKGSTPTVMIVISKLPEFSNAELRVHVASGRRNAQSPTVGIKTLSYTDSIVALMQARDAGFDDALFFDTNGNLSEATASNVFLVKNGALLTPSEDCGILPGITRKVVMELAASAGIRVIERRINRDELQTASEIFLTSSLREIAPVVQLSSQAVGTGDVGPVTRGVMEGYRRGQI